MAVRNLLARSRLEEFATWLGKQGYERQLAGGFEELRMKSAKDTVIIYTRYTQKNPSQFHLTVQDKDIKLVRRFLRETRQGYENEQQAKRD